MKKKLPVSIAEIVIYSLLGLLGVWGIVYMILGFVCSAQLAPFDGGLVQTDIAIKANTNGMGFLEQGILILALAVAAITVTLLVTAKKSDRIFEKDQRRAARIAQRKNPNIVDAEISEVSDK